MNSNIWTYIVKNNEPRGIIENFMKYYNLIILLINSEIKIEVLLLLLISNVA